MAVTKLRLWTLIFLAYSVAGWGENENDYNPPPSYDTENNYQQPPPAYESDNNEGQSSYSPSYQQEESDHGNVQGEGEGSKNGGNGKQKGNHQVDFSHFNTAMVLGNSVDFDGDNSDIDDFDFGLDELERESEINVNQNEIPARDWVLLLENYIKVLSEGKQNTKIKYKIKKATQLKDLEEELVKRGADDFNDDEPDKLTSAKMEYDILTHIRSLPIDKQKIVLDVDRDGVPDFDFVDVTDLENEIEHNNGGQQQDQQQEQQQGEQQEYQQQQNEY